MVYGGEVIVIFTEKVQQEDSRMDGADFGTSELICPFNTIINGFYFTYLLNEINLQGG